MTDLFFIGFILLIVNLIIGVLFTIFQGISFRHYLLKNYPKRIEELGLESAWAWPGFFGNPLSSTPYIFNKIDNNDNRIAKYKKIRRYSLLWNILSLIAIVVWAYLALSYNGM